MLTLRHSAHPVADQPCPDRHGVGEFDSDVMTSNSVAGLNSSERKAIMLRVEMKV